MKCPSCGNNELQQHHRFCCQCGHRLDYKPVEASTGAPLIEENSSQTSSKAKASIADGQPSAENSQSVSSLATHEDKTIGDFEGGAEVFNEDKNSVRVEPIKEQPRNACLAEKEQNNLTAIPHAADKITTAESCPDVGQPPSTPDDQNGKDVLKQEATAGGMSPLEISKMPKGPQSEAQRQEGNVQPYAQEETQTLASRASGAEDAIGPKVHVTSSSADVTNGTPCTASGNDPKTSVQFSDSVTKEQKDLQNSSIEENGVAKESGDGEVTGAPMVGDKSGNKAIPERPQESPGKGDAHGRTENDGEEAVAPEDRTKRSKGVDDGAKGANADKRLNSNAAGIDNGEKTDPGQGTGAVESQNYKTENGATKSPEKELLKDDDGNISQPERGGPEKETGVDDGAKGAHADERLDSNAADINNGGKKDPSQGTGTVESQNIKTENGATKSPEKELLKDDDGNSSKPERGGPEKERGVDDGAKGANADKRLDSNAADINDGGKKDPSQGTGALESQNNKTENGATKSPEKERLKDDDGNSSKPERGGPEKERGVDDGAKGANADKRLNSNAADINDGGKKDPSQGTGTVESQNNKTENGATKSPEKQHLKDDDGNSSQPERGGPEKEMDKKSAEINGKDVKATKSGASKFHAGTKDPLAGQPTNAAHDTAKPDADKEFLNVIFHALLTPTFSLNVHQGERVVLRGQSPFSWHTADKQVNMRVVREVSNGYYILQGETKLTLRQASRNIAYKYCVLRPQAKDLWECLIGFKPVIPGRHVNRCLGIPQSSIKSNGTWHQYDDAVFSEPGFWDSVRNHIPMFRNLAQDPVEGRRMAMMAMLPDWDRISIKEEGLSAHAALKEINNVVYCMSRAEFENAGYSHPRLLWDFDVMQVLFDYFSPRLNLNIQILQVQAEDEDSQAKRLLTSLAIASLVAHHEMTFLRDDVVNDLLECLILTSDTAQMRCGGLDAIQRHFPKKKHKSALADNLLRLCKHVTTCRPGVFAWLFAVPLLHFLSEFAEPFSSGLLSSTPCSVKDGSWWGTQDMDLQGVRRRAGISNTSTPARLLRQLAPMFEIDPLFKRTFLLALPIRDIAQVLQNKIFSLHEVCWTILRVVVERDAPYLADEEWASLERCIREMYDSLDGCDRAEKSQYETMESLARAASQLSHHLLTAHGLAIRKRISVVSGTFQLLGRSILFAKLSSYLSDSGHSKGNESKVEKCQEIFREAFISLRRSLEEHFNGDLFYASESWQQEEFLVWSNLLSVKIDDEELQLFWDQQVREILKCRVYQIDQAHVMELYCKLDLRKYHPEIDEYFMTAAFEALEKLVEVNIKEEDMASLSLRLESSTRLQNSGVGKLFALLLKRCWPKDSDSKEASQMETLQHILSWKPMAQYFKNFGQGRATLPEDGLDLFVSASSLLDHVGLRLKKAVIDVCTLQILQMNRSSFLNLYSLLYEVNGSTEPTEKSEASKRAEVNENQQGIGSIELFLDMRIEELEAFGKERDAVYSFVEKCSMVKSVEVCLNEIKEKLVVDISSYQMLELCHKRSTREEPMVRFFDLSAKNKRMIHSLHRVQTSFLFLTIWEKCLSSGANHCRDERGSSECLTIDQVHEFVWMPSYQRWRDLWVRVISGEINLKEVKERFGKFGDDAKALEVEIEAAMTCYLDEEAILRKRIGQIKQCHKLTECSDAAETILEFQEEMGLEGDFQVLDDFRDQISDAFDRRSLANISDDVLEMGSGLAQITRRQIECLRTVIRCKDYILWLREEVKGGREEVKTLVDLAMMSAGESDMETDRVSWLHTTALGFAPFIFDLNKSIGFSQLMEICESVWKEIEENRTLPDKLEGIYNHLEWLKGVKDDHAMSSLKVAQAINERGVYCVGQLDGTAAIQPSDKKTVGSVVNLLLPSASNGNPPFRTYNLENLQELQSKLALISGKQSSGQEDVEKFGQILQAVIQLGQAYVNLFEIGDVSHLNWNEEYQCKSTMGAGVIDDIDTQSQKFERRYQSCKEHINLQRMKYHELNYFTTQQLLFLRKELAAWRQSSAALQVYSLLEKVRPDIHPSNLQEILLEAGIVSQYDQDDDTDDGDDSGQASMPNFQELDDRGAVDEQVEIVEKYEILLSAVEKLGYPETERLVVAALVANWESPVPDLVVWCVQNKANDDLIDELYDEAKTTPRFRGIVCEEESSQSSQDSGSEDDSQSSAENEECEELDLNTIEEIALDETRGGTYLSLDELGVFLALLASSGERSVRRRFPSYLNRGNPNLILASKERTFAAVLGLYMDDGTQSLPYSDEVLICTSETTSEEVELLWRRALAETGDRIYCLVRGDLLDYDVSQKAVDCLHTLMQDYPNNENLSLVILCSRENEERAYMVAALEEFKGPGIPRYHHPEELRHYLATQFLVPHQRAGLYRDQHVIWSAAAEVGRAENLNVRVVSSAGSGVGKSLVVQRLAEQVENLPNNLLVKEAMKAQNQELLPLCVTIPFHDEHACVSDAVGFFLPHAIQSDVPLSRIFHLDSSCTVTSDLDALLFNLLILGELTDERGRIWRKSSYDLYILEITYLSHQDQKKTSSNCRLLELLPSFTCLSPKETVRELRRPAQRESCRLFDEEEFNSEAVQRTWQYLQRFNENPRLIQEFYFHAQTTEGSPKECLKTLIRNCGVRNPSWSEIRYFVNFLNYQLRDYEQSDFCKLELIEDTLEGFRTFVVDFMIIMSKDFSMRSLKGEEDSLTDEEADAHEELDTRPFQLRRHWEKSIHPYIFFNPDHATLTFLGFRVDLDGNLLDPQTEEIVKENLMSRHLRTGLHVQKVDLNNDFESYAKADKIQRLCSVMGVQWIRDPDESYELTGDNVKKILAIYMRFRCGIPVVIMGETGCGKTRLIRYMCGLQNWGMEDRKNLLLMKIHGGTTLKDIEKNVLHAEEMAVKNARHDIDTVLFFDEANTTEALGMIKEIMVDRRCNGRPLRSESSRLKFIVACNPYRRHTEEMIQKLESAGLGYHVRADETVERFGSIPLRHLVYRVHALPESMRSLVWDFGSLQPDVEERYIRQIVGRYVLHENHLPGDEQLVIAISRVLSASQQFMRNKKDECSFVSLRDVKRAMDVMVWFYKRYEQFSPLLKEEEEQSEDGKESEEEEEQQAKLPRVQTLAQKVQYVDELSMLEESFPLSEGEVAFQPPQSKNSEPLLTPSDDVDQITWSLILALGVCYQARLQQRDEYREAVAKAFRQPCLLPGGPRRIEREISRCQQAVMKELKLGPNIACNAALSENVFMMVVCIELRIPLFVVGKPGSSKSLAKTVVADNMQGAKSPSDLFKTFKQIQLVSYQCSPQSTPEGIVSTFRQCSDLQKGKNTETASDRFASVVVLDEVGLAEDSPKMPLKTLHPLLEDSDSKDDDVIELAEDSFISRVAFIGLSNWALDPAKMNRGIMLSRDEPSENELQETARGICGSDVDIMWLVEPLIPSLVSSYVDLYNKQKTLKRLEDGKKDEFFGLRDFYSLVKMVFHIAMEQKRSPNWQELENAIRRNFGGLLEEGFNPVRVIMTHLRFPPEYLQNEEDHLSLDCLSLIRASLDRRSATGEGRYLLILTENFAALPRVKQLLLEDGKEEPYVIFGSSFPKDQLFTQVCRNINRIKICMETGRTVILLNLESLYESLYDALNQYYVTFGGEKYVDLGLGNHRVKCRVHKEFRLIVIAEKDVVYNQFPIPLINRMEKHFLVMSSGLTEAQKQVTKKLQAWVEDFAEVFQQPHNQKRTFTKGDAFVGFHEDSVPAVVLQVCTELLDDGSKLVDEERQRWEERVLQRCQERLLQCATPDSVTRLRSSRLTSDAARWWTAYFREQEHSSLSNFLVKALQATKSALRAQISTHSRLLSDRDIPLIVDATGLQGCVKCVTLQQFQTEQQFSNCVGREFFAKLGGRESLLIVQCDSVDQTLDLVACSRHLLMEECREMEKELDEDNIGCSHILMIVQLPRVAGGCPGFVSVQGEGWLSVHIDELCPPSEEIPPIEALRGRSVSTIFESVLNKTEENFSVRQILTSCVQEAASRIEDDEATLGRATRRVELLLKLLPPTHENGGRFEMVLADRLSKLLQERDQRKTNEGSGWLETEALSGTMQEMGTFKKALWRRFLSVVAPILSEVIAYVDRDGNLELADSEDNWVVKLWLKILQDSSLTELRFADFILEEGGASVVRSKVPVLKSGYRSHSFLCKFPFSWLLKERMDELCKDARNIAANSVESVTECFRRLFNNSEVQDVLQEAITEGGEAVVDRYLHDYIHMSYKPQDDDELEIVQKAITAAAKEIHCIKTTGAPFEMDLPLVHTAHCRIQQRLNCLSLVLQGKPDVMPELLNTFSWDENEMTVDAIALQMCLERLEPRVEDFQEASRRQKWCDLVLSLKVPLETIICKESSEGKAPIGEKTENILAQCRYMWQRLSAVRMFIEHVYPSDAGVDPEDVETISKLWKVLGDRTDFSKAESLIAIERFLGSCSEDSTQRLQADGSENGNIKFLQCCNAFFMDIVSVFCFGEGIRHLDPKVFEMLMGYVFGTEFAETKQFSPIPGYGMDRSPVVRSFLLQQLINSSDETAKKHLGHFLYKAQGLSSEVPHLLNVCLLAVQCIENHWATISGMNSDLELHVSIGIVNKICQDALQVLEKDFTNYDEIQVLSLEAVAKARLGLDMASKFMYMSVVSDDERWSTHETRGALDFLFKTVKALCITRRPYRSPALFLLKQLVKRYGVHSIATISQNEDMSWIVPAEFQRELGERMPLDTFLVYGELYRKVRDSLAGAILSENMDELTASLEALGDVPRHAKDVILLLTLYREVIVPQRMAQIQQLHPRTLTMMKQVMGGHFSSQSAHQLATVLLENSQEVAFPFRRVHDGQSEIEKALPEVLIHATAVFQCIDFDGLLKPLNAILRNPAELQDSYFPTMPEDSFPETSLALKEGGAWYECPAGHRYFIGECGRPYQERDCPECREPVVIGGLGHQLARANRRATSVDRSNKGHILGVPQKTVAERDLSPAMVSLLRVILHSVMLVGGYRQPEVLSQLTVSEVQAEEVCDFLWEHLVNDVRNLSNNLGRSEDEVLLAVHLVLSEIVERATMRFPDSGGSSMWSTKDGRRNWEKEFVNVFVNPFWKNFEERLQGFYAVSLNDRRLGNDPLMQQVYEVDAPPPPRTAADIHPGHAAFWRYRTRVTVEHVIRQFQDVKSEMATCKILRKFLKEENKLRVLCFLPDIVALQKILTDRLYRRIDKERANQLKMREFLQDLPKGQKDNVSKLFKSFRTAWDLVRHELSSQGRFAPTKEECSKPVESNCTVSVLLPASEGPGVCCKGLMFFLVNAHNELVDAYRSWSTRSTGADISLSEVSASQLIAYDAEKDLLPVMLANCFYSLEVGKETLVQYNWETLEKQIIDRFIRGRPHVEFKVEDFMFREDARHDYSFAALKSKIPQKIIPGQIRSQILSELKDLRDVSDVISTLEIVIGFLSTAGGSPEMKISDYCNNVLLLNGGKAKLKSKKAQQSCNLSHVLDLWGTLALARAKLLFKNKQDPFPQVPECFQKEIPTKIMTRFSGALRKIDVGLFLSKLVEVIISRLPQEDEGVGEMSLKDYLSTPFDEDEEEEGFPGFDEIPEDICVKHVIHAWQLALEDSERSGIRRKSMML